MSDLLATALAMHAVGLAVVPIRNDGSKSPAVPWKGYQEAAPDAEQLRRWFAAPGRYDGLGVLTGPVSGELELLEVEGRAVDLVPQLAMLLADSGLGEVWQAISTGWVEQSPSGGRHWLYRVERPTDGAEEGGGAKPNLKLARRPGEQPGTVDVLIETRGRGGFVVTAPSAGRAHPSGQPWTVLAGGPGTIPTLSVAQRDALHIACSTFDRMPQHEPAVGPGLRLVGGTDVFASAEGQGSAFSPGLRPGDDYNARLGGQGLLDLLVEHGWQVAHRVGDNVGVTRPGKHPRDGISGTVSAEGGFYCFTSSTEFEIEQRYSAFGVYAVLEHRGDHAAAAKALRAAGYGSEPTVTLPSPPPPLPAPTSTQSPPAPAGPPAAPYSHGSSAVALQPAEPAPAPSEDAEEAEGAVVRTLAHSDDANGLALIAAYGERLRHCSDRGRWYAWTGYVWEECPKTAGPAREYAKEIARGLPEYDKADVAWKKKSLSAVGVSATLTSAASDPRVTVRFAELDAHPWEINTPSGIVDLRSGALLPPDPDKLHTRSTLCGPDFEADRSEWLRFLDTTFGGDQALIDYLQRLVGYSAVGVVGPHLLPFCHGSGGNGKGVFLETIVKVLGGYATTAPSGFLMAKTYPGHETEIARLAGARMVLCSEVNDDDRFDEARVKLLTGGDSLTARFMQQDHFTFTPTHQLWAMGNHQPAVRAGGRSFWRRVRLIPFVHEVPEDQAVDDLQSILADQHGPAVLAWIIEGAVAFHQQGLLEPSSVKAATSEYARDQDTVARFLDEACLIGGGTHVEIKASIVRAAYESWCHESGDTPVSVKAFGTAMGRAGIEQRRSHGVRFYVGLSLAGDAESDTRSDTRDGEWYR